MRTATSRSRRPCCRSTASSAPTRCSGPEMRSTGEVMGIATDFPTAFAKAEAAAGSALPNGGTVFITVTDADKPAGAGIAAQLHDLGFEIVATRHGAAIERMGIPVRTLRKVAEGSPHVVDCDLRRRGRPRDQHADRLRRALGRLGDPPRGRGARDPVHHDALGRARPPRARSARARRRAGVISLQECRHAPSDCSPFRPPPARYRSLSRLSSAHVARRASISISSLRRLVVEDTAHSAPGQFYMLAAAERWGGGEASALPGAGDLDHAHWQEGLVEFLLEDVGPGDPAPVRARRGRRARGRRPVRQRLHGAAPESGRCWSAAGSASRRSRACRSPGAAARCSAFARRHARARALQRPALATDDGSSATTGFVTELLDEELATCTTGRSTPAGRPRCSARCERLRRTRRPAQLALEAPMACGFGACYGCVVATVDGYRRVCLDGPVFDAAVLRDRVLRAATAPPRDQRVRVLRRAGRRAGVRRAPSRAPFPFAAYVSKTITLGARDGNPPPRLWESAGRADQLDRAAQPAACEPTSNTTFRRSQNCRCR